MAGPGRRFMPILAALLALPLLATTQPADASIRPSTQLGFRILRNGDQIGQERLRFKKNGSTEKVTSKIDIVYRVAFIPVYRFTQTVDETWRDGRLVAMRAHTDDDGTHHHVAVTDRGDELMVDADGKRRAAPPSIIPASLWNMAVLRHNTLLDTTDGDALPITVSNRGTDTIRVNGERVTAYHYHISGALDRDLWYNRAGRLVRVQFTASDGSQIRFVPS